MSDSGLPTKDDAGVGTKDDSGLGTKDDSGLGTKDDAGIGVMDSGLGAEDATTQDAGPGMEDAGSGGQDSGSGSQDSGSGSQDSGPGDSGPVDAGTPGPDAGGILGCFVCAEQQCAPRVNACVSSPACVEEGTCDLNCLVGSDGGQGGFGNLNCFQSCAKDPRATQRLLAAVRCAFTLCPTECLGALTSPAAGGATVP